MEDIFLARLTTALSGSSHLSASASVSDVINFISRPNLAIFACSWINGKNGDVNKQIDIKIEKTRNNEERGNKNMVNCSRSERDISENKFF